MSNIIKKFINFFKPFYRKYIDYKRNAFLRSKRRQLKNTTPLSIISSNCIGGIIYHNLNLKFNSPTINLYIDAEDYIVFLEHLKDFLSVEPQEIITTKYKFPVGKLEFKNYSVTIFFMHYKSFQEAKDKWLERAKRVNFDNLFIIWEYQAHEGPPQELLERFLKLKYNKRLITGKKCPSKSPEIKKINLYNKNYFYGKILEYRKGLLRYKMHIDKFNYVKFLNTKLIK